MTDLWVGTPGNPKPVVLLIEMKLPLVRNDQKQLLLMKKSFW
jgi:hypothetical protein